MKREPAPANWRAADGGPSTNSNNQPVADPTENVKALTAAGLLSESLLRSQEAAHIRELMALDRAHSKELRIAEADRINAIRAVDVGNVTRAAEVSSAQAAALATSVIQSAEALRVQVEATRITTQDQLETALGPIRTQVESLRVTQFQQQGEKSAQVEGTGDDRFLRVYRQSQDQFVATMQQARSEAAARDAQFLAVLTQSRSATSTARTGWIIGAVIAGASTLVLLLSLVVTLFAVHVL